MFLTTPLLHTYTLSITTITTRTPITPKGGTGGNGLLTIFDGMQYRWYSKPPLGVMGVKRLMGLSYIKLNDFRC